MKKLHYVEVETDGYYGDGREYISFIGCRDVEKDINIKKLNFTEDGDRVTCKKCIKYIDKYKDIKQAVKGVFKK